MRQLGSLLCLLMLAGVSAACDGFVLFVSTGPLPDAKHSPTAPPPPRPIVLGEVVRTTFVVPEVCFDLKAPANGTLFVRISWDPDDGDIDLAFASTVLPATVGGSSGGGAAVRTLRVAAGQSYRIAVTGRQGPVPFTLTTSME